MSAAAMDTAATVETAAVEPSVKGASVVNEAKPEADSYG
jgi:hypothetical protein